MDETILGVEKEPIEEWECDYCGKLSEDEDNKHSLHDDTICEDCYALKTFSCYECGEREHIQDRYETVNGEHICDSCRSNNYYSCASCGGYERDDRTRTCGYCDETYCENCYEENHSNCGGDDDTRDYSREPQRGNPDNAEVIKDHRLVGVELEAVNGSGHFSGLDEKIGITDDGSLDGDNSVEIQTPPASADKLEAIIDNATATLRKEDYKVNDSCGLHIHLDSKDLKENHSKTIKLFNTYYTLEPIIFSMLPKSRRNNHYARPLKEMINEEDFAEIMKKTRTKDSYYLHKKWYNTQEMRYITDNLRNDKHRSRYHGFNLHALLAMGHLELRYHSGTINPKKIKNWIAFNLHILNWATSKKYKRLSLDVLNSVSNEEIDTKTELFFRLMDVPKDLRRYVKRRIEKFKDIDDDDEDDE